MIDAAVIGGGVAGLAAAVRLAAEGRSVTVFEARAIAGGRTFSTNDASSGRELDNGQHLLVGCYRDTLSFLSAVNEGGLQRIRRMRIPFIHHDGRRGTLAVGALPHPLGLAQAFLTYPMLSISERMSVLRLAAGLKLQSRPAAPDLDSISTGEWLRRKGQSANAIEVLWEPLVLATMNTTPDLASAALFVTVLNEMFLSRADASALLLPARGLSEVLVDPAIETLRQYGCQIVYGSGITEIGASGSHLRLLSRSGDEVHAAAVISAIPAWKLHGLLQASGILSPLADQLKAFRPLPILSFHLWLDREISTEPITGLLGGKLQWLFSKGRCVDGSILYSCTVSDPGNLVNEDSEALTNMLKLEICRLFPGLKADNIVRALPMRERKATYAPVPGMETHRPGPATAMRGVFLAGDWTATGLPATIESAVRSGHAAATAVQRFLEAY